MPMMQIQLLLSGATLEAWSEALLAAGAWSLAIEDADRDTPDELAAYAEPGVQSATIGWQRNRVTVLLAGDVDPRQVLAAAAGALGAALPAVIERRAVADKDWVAQTQSQFMPLRLGPIWIVPSWHEPPDPAAINIRIDPGVAFGTGAHPTTRLCLLWETQHMRHGWRVLDYGCGSGILSIAAARLGAGWVVGVDLDPQAVGVARANAQRNGVAVQYCAPSGLSALASQATTAAAGSGSAAYDLVIANILANPIMLLAPTLVGLLAPHGTLLLSGILERQAGAVLAAFSAADPHLRLEPVGTDEGWVALAGARRS